MRTTILSSHPWKGSYAYAIIQEIIKTHPDANWIDLAKDQFNPVISNDELKTYTLGVEHDPLVKKYQTILEDTELLFIVTPIWWYSLPSQLKGFFDKVMLPQRTFTYSKIGTLVGKMTYIKKVYVITTSTSPKWYLQYFRGNMIKKVLINGILHDLGIKQAKWLHQGNIKGITQEKRLKFLKRVAKL